MPETTPVKNTREHILEVALRLFATEGYRQTGMEDIAREVGISKPAIYHYFDGKEVLFKQIVDEAIDIHRRDLTRLRAKNLSLVDLVDETIRDAILMLKTKPNFIRLLIRLISQQDDLAPLLDVHGLDEQIHREEVELLRDAARDEAFRPDVTMEMFVEFYHGVIFSFMARCLFKPEVLNEPDLPIKIRDLILYGALENPKK